MPFWSVDARNFKTKERKADSLLGNLEIDDA